jgi:hypothetical protein
MRTLHTAIPAVPDPATDPDLRFASHYKQHVCPRLRDMCDYQGRRIARGKTTFEAAHTAVLNEAYRLGAGIIRRDLRLALVDQIDIWLATDALAADHGRVRAPAGRH